MEVEHLRAKIKESYGGFSSYEDSGTITCKNFDRGQGWFKTYFLRPNRLLFEWNDSATEEKSTLMVIGNEAQLVLNAKLAKNKQRKEIEKVMEINLPMSMTGGGTYGMSDTILPLLVENSRRPNFTQQKLASLRDQDVNGEPCYHLREIYNPLQIWVSKNDFTVRRFQSEGCSFVNILFDSYVSTLANTMNLFSKKVIPIESLNQLQSPTSADWRIEKVQYNHLTESTFPSFKFKST